MAEEGAKSAFGWRMMAVGALLMLAVALALMSFLVLPQPPTLAPFSGVTRVALATAQGIREHVIMVAAAFLILGAVTGLGYADKLLRPITALAGGALAFFAVAAWWTLRTVPLKGLIEIQ